MMDKDKTAFFESLHQNVSYDLHLGGVILVGIVNLSENVDDGKGGITVFDHFSEPNSICLVKNVDGQLHVFRVNSVKFTGETHL